MLNTKTKLRWNQCSTRVFLWKKNGRER